MNFENDLITIANEKNLSLTENPFGIKRLWPNSYVKLFYNEFCKVLKDYVHSPNILEIEQKNILNLVLWNCYFSNGLVHNKKLKEILNSKRNLIKYNMIIVSCKLIKNNKYLVEELFYLLRFNGVIIIEDIGRNSNLIFKIFMNSFLKSKVYIHDYRLNRFVLDNAILVIKNNKKRKNIIDIISNLFDLIKFIIFEYSITLIQILIKLFK